MRRGWAGILRVCLRTEVQPVFKQPAVGVSWSGVVSVPSSVRHFAGVSPRGFFAGGDRPGRVWSFVSKFEQRLGWRDLQLRQELADAVEQVRRAQFKALREIAQARARYEARAVTVLNSLTLSASGQHVLALGVPTFATALLGTRNPTCNPTLATYFTPQPPPILLPVHPIAEAILGIFDELALWFRALYLWLIFAPAILTAPICLHLGWGRSFWMELVCWTLERSGPAFIKWGQWGATRPDLFPADLCRSLEKLHTQAPTHGIRHSRKEVEQAFGKPVFELFAEFDEQPVASGSIAQVHRALLSPAGAVGTEYLAGTEVAVKVRHPGVERLMEKDFKLMMRACRLASKLPVLSGIRLEESVRQFGGPLHEQLDLSSEAKNLTRFIHNFKWFPSVTFPIPLFPLVSPGVLVETFEDGDMITRFVKQPDGKDSIRLSEIGVDMYLKMLVKDNFLHADLHPGNIVVKKGLGEGCWWGRLCNWLAVEQKPRLVLLDAGMVTELTPQDQHNVLNFFQALTQTDGENVAHNILKLAEHPTCENPKAFIDDMKELFDELDLDFIRKYTTEVIRDMLEKVRQHEVTLKGSVSTLVATTLVLEGWSTQLNPDIRIMDQLREALPKGWNERMSNTLDRIVAQGALADF